MSSTAAGTPDNLILDALRDLQADDERNELVVPAFTVEALARTIEVDVRTVRSALDRLFRRGKVTTRIVPRSGETLYKLADVHHAAWQSLRFNY